MPQCNRLHWQPGDAEFLLYSQCPRRSESGRIHIKALSKHLLIRNMVPGLMHTPFCFQVVNSNMELDFPPNFHWKTVIEDSWKHNQFAFLVVVWKIYCRYHFVSPLFIQKIMKLGRILCFVMFLPFCNHQQKHR